MRQQSLRTTMSVNNMHQIALSSLCCESVHHTLPARANFDKQGKPLLSWRAHLLPMLDDEELYKQFHLDEPWDSEHNKKLIAWMPQCYRNPNSKAHPGMTSYLAVVGKGLMFDGQKGRELKDISDGTSSTMMFVEADDDHAVIWTKPADWEYNAKAPLAGLGHAHRDKFLVTFVDGSVHTIPATIDPAVFHALLTIAGGEVVQIDDDGHYKILGTAK